MTGRCSIVGLLTVLAVSCASDSGKPDPSTPVARKTLSQRLEENNGYTQDSSGAWVPKSDQRSSFETKGKSPYFQGEYDKKAYKAGEYRKKSWWGNKEYGRQKYAGDTDGSRFQKNSRFDSQNARETSRAADVPDSYQTDNYATNAAREAGNSGIAKPSDVETDIRRRVYQAPEIIDWRERRTLSVDQLRWILGR
jgi:hypothetical protein